MTTHSEKPMICDSHSDVTPSLRHKQDHHKQNARSRSTYKIVIWKRSNMVISAVNSIATWSRR